jgi:hypothetical protein
VGEHLKTLVEKRPNYEQAKMRALARLREEMTLAGNALAQGAKFMSDRFVGRIV